jgi:hypothetical protein
MIVQRASYQKKTSEGIRIIKTTMRVYTSSKNIGTVQFSININILKKVIAKFKINKGSSYPAPPFL